MFTYNEHAEEGIEAVVVDAAILDIEAAEVSFDANDLLAVVRVRERTHFKSCNEKTHTHIY